jgi:hypothetical protein
MSSHDMMNPNGRVDMGRVMEPFDPNERLLERILSKENMERAWKRTVHLASMASSSNSFPTIPGNFGLEPGNLSLQVRINPCR